MLRTLSRSFRQRRRRLSRGSMLRAVLASIVTIRRQRRYVAVGLLAMSTIVTEYGYYLIPKTRGDDRAWVFYVLSGSDVAAAGLAMWIFRPRKLPKIAVIALCAACVIRVFEGLQNT